MKLNNLSIKDETIDNSENIKDGLRELELVVNNNYLTANKEISLEYNLATKVGEPHKHLVVYVNPDYKNNPYYFLLEKTGKTGNLSRNAQLSDFNILANLELRRDAFKILTNGFKRLPKHAFLSVDQIKQARKCAQEWDKFKSGEGDTSFFVKRAAEIITNATSGTPHTIANSQQNTAKQQPQNNMSKTDR